MSAESNKLLVVGVGDIHGRFHRVQAWLADLEHALGQTIDLVFAVGDVEAFTDPEDHRRKAAKRGMPAEFAEYASGQKKLLHPLYMIGGNNEDFGALHSIQQGGRLASDVHYLGRVGTCALGGLRVAFLSGIYAPKHIDTLLQPPTSRDTTKQAGYFRRPEIAQLQSATDIQLMLAHEWPRGLIQRSRGASAGRNLRAYRFPWVGNPVTRDVVDRVRPQWLWTGHSHVPFAATVRHEDGSATRVACLDQAAKPDGAIFWMEWDGGRAVRAGWGVSGTVSWREGEAWTPAQTPLEGDLELSADAD